MFDKLRPIAKAIAGAAGGVIASGIPMVTLVPPEVEMPWWGYLLANGAGALIGGFLVWAAPPNRPASKG